jgi:predicted NBD/HSP70 family sugar kinase
VTGRFLDWQMLEDKKAAARLQGFQCTGLWPTTPGGRRLPQHPRQWEWDAQRHVRNLSQLTRPGDRVLIGVDGATAPAIDAAVTHLRFVVNVQKLVATVEVGAVAISHRSPDPPFLGDEIMDVALAEARTVLSDRGCTVGLLGGFIHVENNASMRMATRNGWEPLEDPTTEGYVRWGRPLD